jgi:hypothetical protein
MYVMSGNLQQCYRQAAQIHQANILKSLEHRLEVARAKGEQNLVLQLEAEKRYYTK